MRRFLAPALIIAALLAGFPTATAAADPLPGYNLDPAELERRMDDCLAYAMPRDQVMMGGNSHDPFVDVRNFMRCVDEVVSYGFPRPARQPRYTALIKNFVGVDGQAYVIVNNDTGDIVTAYTTPRDNNWAGCARQLHM